MALGRGRLHGQAAAGQPTPASAIRTEIRRRPPSSAISASKRPSTSQGSPFASRSSSRPSSTSARPSRSSARHGCAARPVAGGLCRHRLAGVAHHDPRPEQAHVRPRLARPVELDPLGVERDALQGEARGRDRGPALPQGEIQLSRAGASRRSRASPTPRGTPAPSCFPPACAGRPGRRPGGAGREGRAPRGRGRRGGARSAAAPRAPARSRPARPLRPSGLPPRSPSHSKRDWLFRVSSTLRARRAPSSAQSLTCRVLERSPELTRYSLSSHPAGGGELLLLRVTTSCTRGSSYSTARAPPPLAAPRVRAGNHLLVRAGATTIHGAWGVRRLADQVLRRRPCTPSSGRAPSRPPPRTSSSSPAGRAAPGTASSARPSRRSGRT